MNLYITYKSFIQFISLKRQICILTGAFTLYVGYRFFTIQNFNDIKELQNILVLLLIGLPIGIIFKTLFFQLSNERDIKKLRSMSYEELLSEKGRKYYLLNRKAFEHVIREFYK